MSGFGFTLAVAADPDASPALISEALDVYDFILTESDRLQFSDEEVQRARGPRVLGDSAFAPYNLPGTFALQGDMATRAGDTELAQRSYYIAARANASGNWLWRTEVERRLDDVEGLQDRLAQRPAADEYEALLPAPAGEWFVAGLISRGGDAVWETYSDRGAVRLPRFVEVRPGKVADITESLMVWDEPDEERGQ